MLKVIDKLCCWDKKLCESMSKTLNLHGSLPLNFTRASHCPLHQGTLLHSQFLSGCLIPLSFLPSHFYQGFSFLSQIYRSTSLLSFPGCFTSFSLTLGPLIPLSFSQSMYECFAEIRTAYYVWPLAEPSNFMPNVYMYM